MLAPEVLIRNEKRLLQQSVDGLISNGKNGRILVGTVRNV
jgi:DNA-directed RNA polymerase subunit beta'